MLKEAQRRNSETHSLMQTKTICLREKMCNNKRNGENSIYFVCHCERPELESTNLIRCGCAVNDGTRKIDASCAVVVVVLFVRSFCLHFA